MGSKKFIHLGPAGAPVPPPKRVHLIAEVAAAKRIASAVLWPSANASAKAPWNTSPAASVSTALTRKVGSAAQIAVFEPHHVAGAVGEGDEGAGSLLDVAQRGFEIVHARDGAQPFGGKHDMRRGMQQIFVRRGGLLAVEDHDHVAFARGLRDRQHEFRITIVDHQHVGAGENAVDPRAGLALSSFGCR